MMYNEVSEMLGLVKDRFKGVLLIKTRLKLQQEGNPLVLNPLTCPSSASRVLGSMA